jgi:hypothetical protein
MAQISQRQHKSGSLFRTIYFIAAGALFVYIVYRAATCALTNDEAYNYLLIDTHYLRAMAATANTHLVNQAGMWLFTLFSDSELAIRLTSVLCFPFYVAGIYCFARNIGNVPLRFLLAALLLLNPYVLDYFSLARGYSGGVAFSTLGLYYLYAALKDKRPRAFRNAWIFLCLAVLASYATFFLFTALAAWYLVFLWREGIRRPSQLDRSQRFQLLMIIGTSIITIAHLLLIRRYGDLVLGSDRFLDTYRTLIEASSYDHVKPAVAAAWGAAFFALLAAGTVWGLYRYRKVLFSSWTGLLCFAFVGLCLISVLLQVASGTPYFERRTALVIYPFLCLLLVYLLAELKAPVFARFLVPAMALLLCTLLSLNAIQSFNSYYFTDWPYQSDMHHQSALLAQLYAQQKPKRGKVYLWSARGPFVNYYRYRHPEQFPFEMVKYDSIATAAHLPELLRLVDYAIVPESVAAAHPELPVIRAFPHSHTVLLAGIQ